MAHVHKVGCCYNDKCDGNHDCPDCLTRDKEVRRLRVYLGACCDAMERGDVKSVRAMRDTVADELRARGEG